MRASTACYQLEQLGRGQQVVSASEATASPGIEPPSPACIHTCCSAMSKLVSLLHDVSPWGMHSSCCGSAAAASWPELQERMLDCVGTAPSTRAPTLTRCQQLIAVFQVL